MSLSRRTQYGLLTLMHLALVRTEQEACAAREIATRHRIPGKYLEQILGQLRRAGLVVSERGAQGGYQLASHPKQITIKEVFQVFGEATIIGTGVSTRGGTQRTRKTKGSRVGPGAHPSKAGQTLDTMLTEIQRGIDQLLQKYTLYDLVERKLELEKVLIYHI